MNPNILLVEDDPCRAPSRGRDRRPARHRCRRRRRGFGPRPGGERLRLRPVAGRRPPARRDRRGTAGAIARNGLRHPALAHTATRDEDAHAELRAGIRRRRRQTDRRRGVAKAALRGALRMDAGMHVADARSPDTATACWTTRPRLPRSTAIANTQPRCDGCSSTNCPACARGSSIRKRGDRRCIGCARVAASSARRGWTRRCGPCRSRRRMRPAARARRAPGRSLSRRRAEEGSRHQPPEFADQLPRFQPAPAEVVQEHRPQRRAAGWRGPRLPVRDPGQGQQSVAGRGLVAAARIAHPAWPVFGIEHVARGRIDRLRRRHRRPARNRSRVRPARRARTDAASTPPVRPARACAR